MKGLSTELKVGAFSLVILAVLTYMTFKVGGFEWTKKKGYIVHAEFKNVAGLDEKTRVKVAGVDAGTIEKISLIDGRAKLIIRINRDVMLYSDASAGIKATGLLGDKYLELKTGSTKPALKDGDNIENIIEIVDIDDLVRKLSDVSSNISNLTSSLNEAVGTPETKRALKDTIMNLKDVTANLKDTISVNDQKLRSVLDNINDLIGKNKEPLTAAVGNIRDFSDSLKTEGPELVTSLNTAAKELKAMVEENRPAIKSATASIDSIAKKIEEGEGTLGKLVKDDRLYESVNKAAEGLNKTLGAVDRFRLFLTFQADYLTKPKDSKGAFYVTLQPNPDKYYILGIVTDPVGSVETTTTTTDGTTVTEKKIEDKIEFTAQFAKRFGDLALRIGFTENTAGVGADYFLFNDKAKISADAWDFSKDEEGAKHPHLKAGVDYFIFKHVFISAGGDNILNKKWRGAYIGAGVRFEDEDLKYLFGAVPKIPTQ